MGFTGVIFTLLTGVITGPFITSRGPTLLKTVTRMADVMRVYAWRIIPALVSVGFRNHVIVSPQDLGLFPFQNGLMSCKWGSELLTNWDDPPSIGGETSMKMLWIFYPEGVGLNDSQI